MKEDLVKIMAAYSKEVDTEFNVYKCVIEDDWNTVSEQILMFLQSNGAGQPNASKPDVSRSKCDFHAAFTFTGDSGTYCSNCGEPV